MVGHLDVFGTKWQVEAESGPRQDTPAQLRRKIRQLIETGKAADPTVAEALAEKGYELIRSWCEAFVEQESPAGCCSALPTQHHDDQASLDPVRPNPEGSIRAGADL